MVSNPLKPFTAEDWAHVALELRGGALDWWNKHHEPITSLGRGEIEAVAKNLRRGDRRRAQIEIVSRMTPDEWRNYRDGTTAQLYSLGAKRARLFGALDELGWLAARILGGVLLKYLTGR